MYKTYELKEERSSAVLLLKGEEIIYKSA